MLAILAFDLATHRQRALFGISALAGAAARLDEGGKCRHARRCQQLTPSSLDDDFHRLFAQQVRMLPRLPRASRRPLKRSQEDFASTLAGSHGASAPKFVSEVLAGWARRGERPCEAAFAFAAIPDVNFSDVDQQFFAVHQPVRTRNSSSLSRVDLVDSLRDGPSGDRKRAGRRTHGGARAMEAGVKRANSDGLHPRSCQQRPPCA